MAKNKKITLGAQAYSFYDPVTGIQFAKGEVKELTPRQLNAARIRKALNSGYLVLADNQDPVDTFEEKLPKYVDKFEKLVKDGAEAQKIAKAFSTKVINAIAEQHGISRDKGDDDKAVVQAIIDDMSE